MNNIELQRLHIELQRLLDSSFEAVLHIQNKVNDVINEIEFKTDQNVSSWAGILGMITPYAKKIDSFYDTRWRQFVGAIKKCGVCFSDESVINLFSTIDVAAIKNALSASDRMRQLCDPESIAESLKGILLQYNETVGKRIKDLASEYYDRACCEIKKSIQANHQEEYCAQICRKIAESFSPIIENISPATTPEPNEKTPMPADKTADSGSIIGAIAGSVVGGVIGSISNFLIGSGIGAAFVDEIGSEAVSLNENKTKPEPKKVDAAIYAPSEAMKGDDILVQVYLYEEKDTTLVSVLASQIDPDAKQRNYIPLSQLISRGDKVRIEIKAYGGVILEETSYEAEWRETMLKHEFVLSIPDSFARRDFLCSVSIFINDIPVGDMKFKTNIVDDTPRNLWADVKSHKYKRSFISYSHADAKKIRFLAEGFKIQGIDYFFDEHSLRTGDIYPKEIDEYILSCDVFVLCWSKNAKTSDWVMRECKLALQRFNNECGEIKIYPISIAPKADLPSILQDKFHFGKIE